MFLQFYFFEVKRFFYFFRGEYVGRGGDYQICQSLDYYKYGSVC